MNTEALSSEDIAFYFRSILSTDERERAERCRIPSRFRQFVAGRALLRTALQKYFNEPTSAIEFAVGLYGKPYIAKPIHSGVVFNLSYQPNFVAIAMGRLGLLPENPFGVGIDIVEIPVHHSEMGAFQTYLSLNEIEYINSSGEDQICVHFAEVWSAKEALGKAIGTGLFTPVRQLSQIGSIFHRSPTRSVFWYHVEEDNLMLSVCAPKRSPLYHFCRLNSVFQPMTEVPAIFAEKDFTVSLSSANVLSMLSN